MPLAIDGSDTEKGLVLARPFLMICLPTIATTLVEFARASVLAARGA
ncbi:hypothetical protein X731_10855 [Mesorhizobium sp. L2C054A000]|nr:hypothetical protein X731_10855 [Mesorhizobium sp. L2C054A000]